VAVFEHLQEHVAWAVEVDTGSEGMRTIRGKMAAYQSAMEAAAPLWGTERWVVVFVVDAPHAVRRRNKIATCAYDECDEGLVYVTTREAVTDANILTPKPWLTPRVATGDGLATLVHEGPWGVATACSDQVLSRPQHGETVFAPSNADNGALPVRPFTAAQVTK
jgi:hypothetical protein